MATMTRRVQVLLDDERYERLASLAEQGGASVGALIRAAIDKAYPDRGVDRAQAAARFLASVEKHPMEAVDWELEKSQIRDELLRVDHYEER